MGTSAKTLELKVATHGDGQSFRQAQTMAGLVGKADKMQSHGQPALFSVVSFRVSSRRRQAHRRRSS